MSHFKNYLVMEKITEHFESLGYPISVEDIGNGLVRIRTNGLDVDYLRLFGLMVALFNGNFIEADDGLVVVRPADFNPDGHGIPGYCHHCGCSEDNACTDHDYGAPCYWVKPDLCSACACEEDKHMQIKAALEES